MELFDKKNMFILCSKPITRYDQLQRKTELLHKAILNTSGDMQNIWKKHLKEIVKLVNSLSIKELSEEVK